MADDGGGSPRGCDDWFADEVGGHEEISDGGEDEGVEDVRNHENWVQHDREAEEDRFVDLKDLGGQAEARDFAEAGFAGVYHDQRKGDGGAGTADVYERGEESVGGDVWQRLVIGEGGDVGGEVLEENRSDNCVHRVVAVDADRPEHGDEKSVGKDAR